MTGVQTCALPISHDLFEMKKSGASEIAECPKCHKNKLTFTYSKKIYKCFSCEQIQGKDPIGLVMQVKELEFVEACRYLAKTFNIELPKKKEGKKKSFCERQLLASGILKKNIQFTTPDGDSGARYLSRSFDDKWKITSGDDMIIRYLDLNWEPIYYYDHRQSKKPFYRIRYSNPSLHLDKNGKPKKYSQPSGSKSEIYFPNAVIKTYQDKKQIDTLYVIEGEKKADKACQHGMFCVGVGGIHNFASHGNMPHQFQQLIRECSVKNVVFLLDSDCFDLSKTNPDVDFRPKTFFRAVVKFRNYFYAYINEGIELNIYFGYHLDQVQKGLDDLMVYEFKKQEKEIVEDFEKARIDREGKGKWVMVHDITSTSDYKLKEMWHLHDPESFMNHYQKELKDRIEFRLKGIKRRWNANEGKFELTQKLMPYEKYWSEEVRETRDGREYKKISFDYVQVLTFLRNRGYGIYKVNWTEFRYVHIENKVVREIEPFYVRRFLQDFTRSIGAKDVLQMILKGGNQYLGPDKLANMDFIDLQFMKPEENAQFLYFKNVVWKITADEIREVPYAQLPANIWEEKMIDFEPQFIGRPMVTVSKNEKGKWKVTHDKEVENKSDILQYFLRTSKFFWKKKYELGRVGGVPSWVPKSKPSKVTREEFDAMLENYVAKMIAAGYAVHEYRDYSNMKAIICMDGEESEVGKSKGGSGKSLWSRMFEYVCPMFNVNGKNIDNKNPDNFLLEGVDERTQIICIDDVRVNFDFERFFTDITTQTEVNRKGKTKIRLEPKRWIINTNHAVNGSDESTLRRQYTLAFSDWYNLNRTPKDDFGHQLFHEWDFEQWNLFYNYIANCIQVYLQHGLVKTGDQTAIERRKLRQQIGETFLDWATLFYDPSGSHINHAYEKQALFEFYRDQNPKSAKYLNTSSFKQKLRDFCEYANFEFNPHTKGERHKSNSKEFITVANKAFDFAALELRNNIDH